jgi:7-carboxy-7-deazaguanine synthase
MGYAVKEVFYTLQGEGMNAGRAAVFCRFAGCNLWSGRAEDRHRAVCGFCDTDFVGTNGTGGGRFGSRFAVLTGGEPLLQVDDALIRALHAKGFEIAVETNGTIEPPEGIDWICVSPKALPLVARRGDELKLVYPNPRLSPADVEGLGFRHLLLQPMDDTDAAANTAAAVAFCLDNPHWRLTLQNHKHVGIR